MEYEKKGSKMNEKLWHCKQDCGAFFIECDFFISQFMTHFFSFLDY